jgi:hypothetical protein
MAFYGQGSQIRTGKGSDKVEIRQTIETLFEGMHTLDTAKVRSVFGKDVLLQTIPEDRPGGAVIESGDLEQFIGGLANIPPNIKIEERLWNWDIKVDGHLATTWTEYTFFVNDEVSHCGANAFQLFEYPEGWKITKIIDTRSQHNCRTEAIDDPTLIGVLLDNWYKAAAEADEDVFFGSMAEDAIYLGTDKTERWLRDEMKAWSAKYFERESAWAFKPFDRNIYVSEDGTIAWWEEKLETWMGVCLGSGVLAKTEEGWKIKHFHLGVTIDNDKIQDFIKLAEGK